MTLLGEVCRRFNWRCHAYCEMTNHYHFVVVTPTFLRVCVSSTTSTPRRPIAATD